jgi:hypothetical protein
MKRWILGCVAIAMVAACGGSNSSGPGGDGGGTGADGGGTGGDGGGTGGDGGGTGGDGGGTGGGDGSSSGCAGLTQCSNCIDDDADGRIDGFDIECTGAGDNDEASFATGIPGDNKDRVSQDCFFDGDSGAGNDGCDIHVCCLLGATSKAECPIGTNRFDPTECPPPIGTGTLDPMCTATCKTVTPPGCDCFGCCTICDPVTNQCFDINLNQVVSPDCTEETLSDPTKCKTCTKNTLCNGGDCGGEICTLCPGQDPSDLPAECGGMNQCPNGEQTCMSDAECPTTAPFCATGCCIADIIL